MQQVDGKARATSSVQVAERCVGHDALRVLPDAERAGHLFEVPPPCREERPVRHRQSRPSPCDSARCSAGRAPRATRANTCRYAAPTSGQCMPRLYAYARRPCSARNSRFSANSMSALGERFRGAGGNETAAAVGQSLARIGIWRRHDRLARAHRVRQRPGDDLLEVGVRRHEDVRRLSHMPSSVESTKRRRSGRGRRRRATSRAPPAWRGTTPLRAGSARGGWRPR